MFAVGSLVFNLIARTDRFSRGLNQAQSRMSRFVSGAASSFAKLNHAVGGVQTALSLLSEPLDLAMTQLKAERKLEQVFKSTGNAAGFAADEIFRFASARQAVTDFGDENTIGAAAVLGSFTNIRGDQFKGAIVAAQDLSAFLDQDLQSSIMQVGKALNDPARGLSALSRSGIQFSKSQTEQIKKLQEMGRVAEAQQIILKEFSTQFGGQAEALSEPIIRAKNFWGDYLEEIGKGTKWMVDTWISAGDKIADSALRNQFKMAQMSESMGLTNNKQSLQGMTFEQFQERYAAFKKEKDLLESIKNRSVGGGIERISTAEAMKRFGSGEAPKEDPFISEMKGFLKSMPKANDDALRLESRAVAEAVKTPVEVFQDKIDDLTAMYEKGFLTDSQFDRASQMAVDNLPGQAIAETQKEERARNEVRGLEVNSQEAYDVLRANVGGKPEEKQLKVQQSMDKSLKEIAKEIKKGNTRNDIEERGFD